jgi:hypothetical protein
MLTSCSCVLIFFAEGEKGGEKKYEGEGKKYEKGGEKYHKLLMRPHIFPPPFSPSFPPLVFSFFFPPACRASCGSDLLEAYVSIRQHTSAYVSIRQHTSAFMRSL